MTRRPITLPTVNGNDRAAQVARYLLFAIGLIVLVVAALLPQSRIAAVPLAATARGDLTASACNDGGTLIVAFDWHGSPTTQIDYAPDCSRDYHLGDQLTVYAASNDPSNLGPTADWIRNPDEHDPFDFIGPNGLPGFIGTIGVVLILMTGLWQLISWRRHRRAVG